jgi:hypothetical protein
MNNKKPDQENVIFKNVLASQNIDLEKISDKDLKIRIKDEVIKANYLNEEWQIDYAVQRIMDRIESKKGEKVLVESIKTQKTWWKSLLYILLLLVFLVIGSSAFTWRISIFLEIIITIVSIAIINFSWEQLKRGK